MTEPRQVVLEFDATGTFECGGCAFAGDYSELVEHLSIHPYEGRAAGHWNGARFFHGRASDAPLKGGTQS